MAFFVVSMGGMLMYANEKAEAAAKEPGNISGGYPEESGDYFETRESQESQEKNSADIPQKEKEKFQPRPIVFNQKRQEGKGLCIELPQGITAENVIVDNRYMEGELWITVLGGKAAFYDTQPLYGDTDGIAAGTYQETKNGVLLRLALDDVYECRSTNEEGKIYLTLEKPGSVYEKIVVIDPVYSNLRAKEGTLQEKDITLDIALRLKDKLDGTQIKAFFTRLEDVAAAEEKRIGLAQAAEADFVISIGTSQKEDTAKYGTDVVYNSEFFAPERNSVELADGLLRQVVTRISGRAEGLVKATPQEAIVWEAPCPAVLLRVGYLTNEQEAALLAREDYREKIAEGIYQAILQIYEGEST